MQSLKKNAVLVLILALLLFALQNLEPVAVKLLFWSVQAPLVIAITASAVLGAAAATLWMSARGR